jgi:hypothetical protein
VNKIFITFTQNDELYSTIQKIKNNYTVLNNKILVLQTEYQSFACVYILEPGLYNIDKDSICVHRKKLTNTYYTINGLNCLITTINNGILDKSYPIIWENYKNCIIVSSNNILRKINTSFYKNIDI